MRKVGEKQAEREVSFQGIPIADDDEGGTLDDNARRYRYAYAVQPSTLIKPRPDSVHKCWPVELRERPTDRKRTS